MSKKKKQKKSADWQDRFRQLNDWAPDVLCLVPNNYAVPGESGEDVWEIVRHGVDDYDESIVATASTVEEVIELAFKVLNVF